MVDLLFGCPSLPVPQRHPQNTTPETTWGRSPPATPRSPPADDPRSLQVSKNVAPTLFRARFGCSFQRGTVVTILLVLLSQTVGFKPARAQTSNIHSQAPGARGGRHGHPESPLLGAVIGHPLARGPLRNFCGYIISIPRDPVVPNLRYADVFDTETSRFGGSTKYRT